MKYQVFTLAALFASASMALAVTPKGVPEGYVVTPFGYFHASCVQHVGDGDVVSPEESAVHHPDGSVESMHVCSFAHFTATGEAVAATAKNPSIKHAWIEDVYTTTSTSYGALITEWKVPPTPKSNDGQTVYFFPGLEDIKDVKTILQPVLGFQSAYKNAWDIASWNCCESGTVYVSPAVKVKPGDTIVGEIVDNCKAGTLECKSWKVVTADKSSKKSTTLGKTGNFGQTFNWAFANVLEVYNVVKCADLPPNDELTASGIELYNNKFQKISSPKWIFEVAKVTPKCGYGAFGSESKITITY